MAKLNSKTKKLVASKEKHIKTRHIPKNQYGHVDTDPIVRYLYKYNFDHYCESFTVVDLETGGRKERFKTILELIMYLTQPGQLFPDGIPDFGIPIVENGMVCTHSEELDDDDNLDPYFTCVITVNHLGTAEKPKKGHFKVFSVRS